MNTMRTNENLNNIAKAFRETEKILGSKPKPINNSYSNWPTQQRMKMWGSACLFRHLQHYDRLGMHYASRNKSERERHTVWRDGAHYMWNLKYK